MRFAISATVFAFAASVLAQTPGFDVISKPTKDEVVPAGATYAIEWAPNTNWTGTVTLSLLGGASQGLLQDLGPFASKTCHPPTSRSTYTGSQLLIDAVCRGR